MRSLKSLIYGFFWTIFIGLLFSTLPDISYTQTNPCAPKAKKTSQNPCAVNPCAVKNPCAANPCAPGARTSGSTGKAITVRGEIVKVDPSSGKLVLKVEGKQLDLTLSKHSVVRAGAQVKRLADIKPGERVAVSYVESGKGRTAWYVYLASAAPAGNPCAANPCAAKNPCATKNPCAANPCAAKQPRSANPCNAK